MSGGSANDFAQKNNLHMIGDLHEIFNQRIGDKEKQIDELK